MKTIKIQNYVDSFAENKDTARKIRLEEIMPEIEKGKEITIDFENVDGATQSFIHAMISEIIRSKGSLVIDSIYFKNCNETIKKIITIVIDYMQESER